jgi:hypothetical protein
VTSEPTNTQSNFLHPGSQTCPAHYLQIPATSNRIRAKQSDITGQN